VWKLALDVGLSHPKQRQPRPKSKHTLQALPTLVPESASADLEKTQHSFAESLKDGEADTITDNASDDIRLYRSGQLPAVGKRLPRKCLPKKMQKRLARQGAHSQASRTMPRSMESIFASGASNQTALGKSSSTFKRARRQKNRKAFLSFRA
jgi:hypothetical protein